MTLPRLIVCLPGSGFSDKWLAGWNALYSKLVLEYRVTVIQASGNNIYDVRNVCVRKIAEFVSEIDDFEPEHVLWIDSDNIVSFEGFQLLHMSLTAVAEASAVGAWYLFQPPAGIGEGEQPMIAAGKGDDRPTVDDVRAAFDAGAYLLEMDYIGFGFLLMDFRMLDKLGLLPFCPILRDDGDCETDDATFGLRATQKGHKLFLNAAVHAPHLKLLPIPVSMRTGDRQGIPSRRMEVDRDAGIEREAGSTWWVPIGCQSLPSMLAEMEAGIYGAVRKGDVVLDCGANVGVFAKSAIGQGASGVIAIEADPITARALAKNCIGAATIAVVRQGVWECETELTLSRDDRFSSANSLVILRGEGEQKVPVTTIDKLVESFGMKRVDFIKMDIEGAEKQALLGSKETIRKFRPRLAISCEHFTDDVEQITAIVDSFAPYRCERSGDVLFFEPKKDDTHGTRTS